MAISYCVLSSGSGGNCLWVRGGGVEVLVDCGLSARAIRDRLAEAGGDLRDVQAVLCTHGHGDHVSGAAVLARRHHLDVYATAGTLRGLSGEPPQERLRPLPREGRVAVGGLEVRIVPTLHDAPDSVAFVLSDGETSLGVVTDLGVPTARLTAAFEGLDGLVLEMNHDEEMLLFGPYPAALKQRIRGDLGHLSNRQGGDLLRRLCHPGLQHVTLAHLSEHNNTPDRARAAAEGFLEDARHHPALACAAQAQVGAPVALRARRQLSLKLW